MRWSFFWGALSSKMVEVGIRRRSIFLFCFVNAYLLENCLCGFSTKMYIKDAGSFITTSNIRGLLQTSFSPHEALYSVEAL